jgi:hypothetical protein
MDDYDKEIWLLIMANIGNNDDWDVFGAYSSYEKAEKTKEQQRIKNDGMHDGMYEGCRPDLLYDTAIITLRLLDHNLPQ